MERAHDRFLERFQAGEGRLHVADERAERECTLPADIAREHREVDARGEDGPLAVDHDRAHVRLALGRRDRVDQREQQLPVDGVALLGPVERHVEQRRLAAAGDERGHGTSSVEVRIMRGRCAARNRFTHPGAVAISRRLMRSVIDGLFVALLVAEPALAGSILYATAASQQRIDGFCLGADGALAASPSVQVGTQGRLPRRVLVGKDVLGKPVLYVAEADRIEAFKLGDHGGLSSLGDTRAVRNPQDLALSPDGKTLYVTHQGFLEPVALAADGSLPTPPRGGSPDPFTSCIQGEPTNTFLDAQATRGLLYVSADDIPGRIAIYRLNPDGSLPQTGCRLNNTDASKVKTPDSERKRLQRPKAFLVVGDFVYVEERALRRLTAFRLPPDGPFCDRGKDANGNVVAESCGDIAYFLPTPPCAR